MCIWREVFIFECIMRRRRGYGTVLTSGLTCKRLSESEATTHPRAVAMEISGSSTLTQVSASIFFSIINVCNDKDNRKHPQWNNTFTRSEENTRNCSSESNVNKTTSCWINWSPPKQMSTAMLAAAITKMLWPWYEAWMITMLSRLAILILKKNTDYGD